MYCILFQVGLKSDVLCSLATETNVCTLGGIYVNGPILYLFSFSLQRLTGTDSKEFVYVLKKLTEL